MIEQQVVLDDALVPSNKRLRIGRSNFRLPSDIQSKESTLHVVYDVLRRSRFFKAFLVMADVPEIYMQEFWATAYVHQHSIRFKMDTRKNIVDLEAFREMLHISPRVLGQSFAELPFEEEILEFLRFFIIAVQTPGSGISILLAVGTPSTGSGNLYCQWELSPGIGFMALAALGLVPLIALRDSVAPPSSALPCSVSRHC
nr:hypothetical protein [Tanacetum cinerariifolium]